jgi:hypothetical protein
MAGGALSLAGMGRGGYAPRIYARPELIHDEVFAPWEPATEDHSPFPV